MKGNLNKMKAMKKGLKGMGALSDREVGMLRQRAPKAPGMPRPAKRMPAPMVPKKRIPDGPKRRIPVNPMRRRPIGPVRRKRM